MVKVSVFKALCNNNAQHKLVYSIGNSFNSGACNYKNCQRLPMVIYLVCLRG